MPKILTEQRTLTEEGIAYVRSRMKALGMKSQRALALRSGLPETYLSKVLNGALPMTAARLKPLAESLQLSEEDFRAGRAAPIDKSVPSPIDLGRRGRSFPVLSDQAVKVIEQRSEKIRIRTRRELASLAGIGETDLALFLAQKRGPDVEVVRRLARVLGVPVAALLGITDGLLTPDDSAKRRYMWTFTTDNLRRFSDSAFELARQQIAIADRALRQAEAIRPQSHALDEAIADTRRLRDDTSLDLVHFEARAFAEVAGAVRISDPVDPWQALSTLVAAISIICDPDLHGLVGDLAYQNFRLQEELVASSRGSDQGAWVWRFRRNPGRPVGERRRPYSKG